MIVVIIAGGSGTRLWPLSTPDYPKQLLTLVGDDSMAQATYARAKQMATEVYVLPDVSHAHHIREQLPELDDEHCIVEPGRRGTANCIISALAYLSKRHSNDEPVVFLWADHHIRDVNSYVRSFELAAEVSEMRGKITLIGIEPTHAATGFGYIERDGEINGLANIHQVESFKEKPDFETAKQYIASGKYLWNAGYFVGSVNTFLKQMDESAPDLRAVYNSLASIDDINSDEYKSVYLGLENEVIETALIERSHGLAVVSGTFDWRDLGSFKDLHDASDGDSAGNAKRGNHIYEDEVENSYIRNEEDKPVVVIGLDNVVVVNTKHGILVSRKDLSQNVKDAVQKIQAAKE
jgi:mannose-1-phosphate guanylyltransferase